MPENINTSEVARIHRMANIRMLSDEISIFINEYGQQTPILIVARCTVDGLEYAALFDTKTAKCYSVEVVREKGKIKYFKDMDTFGRDEEWAVISNYFLDNNVYERNRIIKWLWNTKISAALGKGIPKTVLERWDKKKYKKPDKKSRIIKPG